MAEGAIFINSGPLFNGEHLESMEELPEWQDDAPVREAYERIRECFEKHATLLAGNPSVEETRFHMVNPTLHALGYTHSVHEPVQLATDRMARIDYVLFTSAEDFYEAQGSRGSTAFFRQAVGISKAVAWSSPLDGAPDGEETEEGALIPATELDLLLRTTGKDYGILTNGCDWRLYHRGTSSLISTFFQADMIGAIKSDFEDFKRFYLLFRKDALGIDDSGTSYLDRMLQ